MSGALSPAEHYQKAMDMLAAAEDAFVLDDDVEGHNMRVAAAQVHATLALSCTVATAFAPFLQQINAGRN